MVTHTHESERTSCYRVIVPLLNYRVIIMKTNCQNKGVSQFVSKWHLINLMGDLIRLTNSAASCLCSRQSSLPGRPDWIPVSHGGGSLPRGGTGPTSPERSMEAVVGLREAVWTAACTVPGRTDS